eukprot:gene17121-23562_t
MKTYNSTVDSTKSLRPKEFIRNKFSGTDGTDSDKFVLKSLNTLKMGTYNEIDLKCQLSKYERTQYQSEHKVQQEVEKERNDAALERALYRNDLLQHTKQLRERNQQATDTLKHNWAKTQMVKKDRQVRDLQYEMTVAKISDLKKSKDRLIHRNDQVDGVNYFEKIMQRSGIGSADSGGTLTVSYETGDAFINRLEANNASKWPSNEEISDFKTQLKSRTTEKRTARYEKARRRRRAQVDQAAAAASNTIYEDSQDERDNSY